MRDPPHRRPRLAIPRARYAAFAPPVGTREALLDLILAVLPDLHGQVTQRPSAGEVAVWWDRAGERELFEDHATMPPWEDSTDQRFGWFSRRDVAEWLAEQRAPLAIQDGARITMGQPVLYLAGRAHILFDYDRSGRFEAPGGGSAS